MSDKRVTVYPTDSYRSYWPGDTLIDACAWFAAKLEQVPEKYRAEARCEIGSESGYECGHNPTIEIYYYRLETKEEKIDRINKTRERIKAVQDREINLLKELQVKYGNQQTS